MAIHTEIDYSFPKIANLNTQESQILAQDYLAKAQKTHDIHYIICAGLCFSALLDGESEEDFDDFNEFDESQ